MVRTQIQLTEEQSKTLKMLAHKRHTSISRLIRDGIDLFLRSNITQTDKKEQALHVIGKFHSGKKDLSVHHDIYLNENS